MKKVTMKVNTCGLRGWHAKIQVYLLPTTPETEIARNVNNSWKLHIYKHSLYQHQSAL
jgi:hypothetical protein